MLSVAPLAKGPQTGIPLPCSDTAVLCDSLTYERGPPAVLNGNAVPGRPWTTVYSPPFDEFEVLHVSIPEKARFQGIQTYLPENLVSLRPSNSVLPHVQVLLQPNLCIPVRKGAATL